MRGLLFGLFGAFGSLSVACAGIGTPASHAQEAMSNVAENLRFGRSELVLEHLAPGARDKYVREHAAWGGRLTIADTEFANFRMIGTDDAEVDMRVTWYDQGNQELRSTLLHQKWHGPQGSWLLTSEERVDGDVGLLGEKITVQVPDEAPASHAQFPTIRIGARD